MIRMNYRELGATGLKASEIGMGCEGFRDYAPALAAFPKISWRGHCMYCNHCAPCPFGVSVRENMKKAEAIFGR